MDLTNILWINLRGKIITGYIALRAGLEPTLFAILELACKPLHYLGSLIQSPYVVNAEVNADYYNNIY